MSMLATQNAVINGVEVGLLPPTFQDYAGQSSFFGGDHALSVGVGYAVVLGFGVFFSVFTTGIIYLNQKYGSKNQMTSEHFK
jgi:urea-proton symporter